MLDWLTFDSTIYVSVPTAPSPKLCIPLLSDSNRSWFLLLPKSQKISFPWHMTREAVAAQGSFFSLFGRWSGIWQVRKPTRCAPRTASICLGQPFSCVSILLLVGGDAATAMWEEPASNLTFILKQNLSLGEVIFQKRKDKQKMPCRFSALTVVTRQLQKCEWHLLCGFTQDTYLQAQSFELVGSGLQLGLPLLPSPFHTTECVQENLDGQVFPSPSLGGPC